MRRRGVVVFLLLLESKSISVSFDSVVQRFLMGNRVRIDSQNVRAQEQYQSGHSQATAI